MLYLYTGVPGAGKTLHMVSQLHKDPQFKERPLYVDGITDLDPEAIPHNALPEGCNGSNWHQWLPEGSILIIDECQRYWRPRPNGSAVPPAIQALETHRHKGIDIYFLTQDPKKIDSQIRNLIEVHKHFSMSALGIRRCFEWRNKVGDHNSKADIKTALVTPYFLDESVYDFYTSAVQHNQVKAKKSKLVYVLPAAFVFGIFLVGFSVYRGLTYKTRQAEKQQIEQQQQKEEQNEQNTISKDQIKSDIKNGLISGFTPKTASEANTNNDPSHNSQRTPTEEDFKPQVEGQPWTAPVYSAHNSISNIKTMPYPVACIVETRTRKCTCWEEQGTKIKGMSKELCIDFAENGIYNPYKSKEELQPEAATNNAAMGSSSQSTQATTANQGQLLELTGKPKSSLSPDLSVLPDIQ